MKDQLISTEEHFRKEIIRKSSPWIGACFFIVLLIRTVTGYIKIGPAIFAALVSICFFLIPTFLEKGISSRICSIFLLAFMTSIGLVAGIFNGGVQAPANIVFATLPLVGFLTAGEFGARIALLFSMMSLGLFIFGEHLGFIQVFQRPTVFSDYLTLAIFLGTLLSYLMGRVYEATRKKNERRILELVGLMQENSRLASLGEMASGIAHEINNPLSIIIGTADRVKRMLNDSSKTKEQVITELDNLRQVAFRAGSIAQGLQAFSRDAQTDPFAIANTREIVEATLKLCQERYKNNGVNLQVKMDADTKIECREIQISQVLLNLLNNAYDAVSDLQDKWITLNISAPQNNKIQMIVTDSGSGISPRIAEKLMEPFFTTKEVGKGTGLGLSISHRIVADHQGTLELDTTSPNTRFIVTLPLNQ